ncbi:carbohydrate ABC transporter permease [Rhodobacter maris]|uniref:Sorbitol ABC transporter membrane protein /mannitol ABC transporter membrane protein n=1 Tax=Rhodobacter maris TaxID=446682 RepID=A0A285S311_9RHOB|nr:carbohydrate ABC transporter permease [Rhodobacter maris]SOB99479.1 sorbitol ABC transporter membrane protein /mannitol ABC transporter membrane protein [Rhodobacter maris]
MSSLSPLLRKAALTLLGWSVGLTLAFPILWTALVSFRSEADALGAPAAVLAAPFTLESYAAITAGTRFTAPFVNSVLIAGGATALALLVALPAAWALALFPGPRTKALLMTILGTRMMPAVGVLVPVYLLFRDLGLLDSRAGLIVVVMLTNLPVAIWMLYGHLREIPGEIFEAARMDGAGPGAELRHVIAPLAAPGIAATALLCLILGWNEAFWTLNLSAAKAAPLSAFIAAQASPEGLFHARLCAAAMLASLPVLGLGWIGQRALVRGLTFGAVK